MAALGGAVRAFVQRELGAWPTWVEVGEGVALSPETIEHFELELRGTCRPGHLRVGRDATEQDEEDTYGIQEDGKDTIPTAPLGAGGLSRQR